MDNEADIPIIEELSETPKPIEVKLIKEEIKTEEFEADLEHWEIKVSKEEIEEIDIDL